MFYRHTKRVAAWALAALVLSLPGVAGASTYSKSQKAALKGPGASVKMKFDQLPVATGQLSVQVDLVGDYENRDRVKMATLDVDGAQKHAVCKADGACAPSCSRTPYSSSYKAPAKLVADGVLVVSVSNNKFVEGCRVPTSAAVTLSYPTNAPPVARPLEMALDEDTSTSVALKAEDNDGDTLSYEIAEAPAHGTLSGTPPKLTYTPEADYFGADSFKYVASDGTATSEPAEVRLRVRSVNDPPEWTAPEMALFTVVVGDMLSFELAARDVDDETLDYIIEGKPEGSEARDGNTRFVWTPSPEQVGTHEMVLTASDGEAKVQRDVVVEVVERPMPDVGDTGMSDAGRSDVGLPDSGGDADAGDAGDVGASADGGDAGDVSAPDTARQDVEPEARYSFEGGAGCSVGGGAQPVGWFLGLLFFLALRRRV